MKLLPKLKDIIISNKILVEAFPTDPPFPGRQDTEQQIIDYFNEFFPDYLFPNGVPYIEFLDRLKLEKKNASILKGIDLRNALLWLMPKFQVSDTLEIENIEEVQENIYFPGNILFKKSIDLNNYEINVTGSVKCLGDLTIYEANIGEGIEAETLTVRQSISNNMPSFGDKFYVNVKKLIMKGYYPNQSFGIPECHFECDYLEMNDGAVFGDDRYGAERTRKKPYKPWIFKVKKAVLKDRSRVLGRLIGDDVEMYGDSSVSENHSKNIVMFGHSSCKVVKNSNKLVMNEHAHINKFENVKQLVLNYPASIRLLGDFGRPTPKRNYFI